jgi:hypothetical protein
MRAVRSGEIGCDRVSAATGLANFSGNLIGFLGAVAVMNENLRACFGERRR